MEKFEVTFLQKTTLIVEAESADALKAALDVPELFEVAHDFVGDPTNWDATTSVVPVPTDSKVEAEGKLDENGFSFGPSWRAAMKVKVTVEETTLEGEHGDVDGVIVTCGRCDHSVEVFGAGEASIKRGCATLRDEVPQQRAQFLRGDVMSSPIIWMAHPLSAPTPAGVAANLGSAKQWLAWLYRTFPRIDFAAAWIPCCEAMDDANPVERERGLSFDCEMIRRLDGYWMVGGRISSGMARERDAALEAGKRVFDLTKLGAEPPTCDVLQRRSFVFMKDEGWLVPGPWREVADVLSETARAPGNGMTYTLMYDEAEG